MKFVDYFRDVKKRFNGEVYARQGEWIVGIVEETAEVLSATTLEEAVEELGDLLFYCVAWVVSVDGNALCVVRDAMLAYERGRQQDGAFADNFPDLKSQHLMMDVATSLGGWKKVVFHGYSADIHFIQYEVSEVLARAMLFVSAKFHDEDYYLEDILEKNTAKRHRRYPDGFSQAASQNRDCT
jgi:NTP pyrophosphatase (non-canonical NTP hydrolase)